MRGLRLQKKTEHQRWDEASALSSVKAGVTIKIQSKVNGKYETFTATDRVLTTLSGGKRKFRTFDRTNRFGRTTRVTPYDVSSYRWKMF